VSKDNINFGKSAEDEAADFLKKSGYKILERNYRTNLGEIDIIARDKDTICFIEVKARRSDKFGLPQESVFNHKQKQISRTALLFLKTKNLLDKKARFDVVSVLCLGETHSINLIKNAFDLEERFTY